MAARPYRHLLDLLRDDGQSFKDRMADVDADQIADIIGHKVERPRGQSFAEHYFTLVGRREGDTILCDTMHGHTQYNPHLVEFDWQEVWNRHLEHGDVIGWFHTHPPGAHDMSRTDRDTFTGWIMALGGPRYAVILCDGVVHAWKLTRDGVDLAEQMLEAVVLSTGRIIIKDPE